MTTYKFVLVHGGWHDGSAWTPVVQHLRLQGHQAWAPTIAGHGKNVDKNVTHDQCTASIVDYIVGEGLDDIVLVGHSFGGSVVGRVAQRIPERIRRLVFWNAFVLNDGESVLGSAPPHQAAMLGELARATDDNTITVPFPFWRECMINDADLETATRAYEQLSPEPYGPSIEKLDMKKFYELIHAGKLPCSYVNCTEDNVMPWHPQMSNRLGLFRLVQMPGSHETLFTNPRGLAEKLIEAGRD